MMEMCLHPLTTETRLFTHLFHCHTTMTLSGSDKMRCESVKLCEQDMRGSALCDVTMTLKNSLAHYTSYTHPHTRLYHNDPPALDVIMAFNSHVSVVITTLDMGQQVPAPHSRAQKHHGVA